MSKFGINDIIDVRNRPAEKGRGKGFQEIWLSPYDVVPSEDNFYSQENIEELADSFLAVGQQQPTVLARTGGQFVIVSGHRRNLANIMNLKRGHKEYEKVRYLYRDMTDAMLQLSLLMGNACNRELTAWEKTQQAQRLKEALLKAKKADGLEITGKLRDMIADLMHESSSNIARMERINNNATPEIKEEFRKGNLGISAAYEVSKLPQDQQKIFAEKSTGRKDVQIKEIAGRAEQKKDRISDSVVSDSDTVESHINLLRKWKDEDADIIQRVSDSDTEKNDWTEREWVIFMAEAIIQKADSVDADDLQILHDIMVRCYRDSKRG